MWATINQTPYRADGTWWRDTEGVHVWLVAIKVTFDIASDGKVTLADAQIPVVPVPEYQGDPNNPSLRYESDLLPLRPVTDVVLNATAYSPLAKPTSRFRAGFRIGEIRKEVTVYGPRFWRKGPLGHQVSEPAPVVKVPITWQNAFGGYDDRAEDARDHRIEMRNPCGRGTYGPLGVVEGAPVHQVEHSSAPKTPAGIAAIPAHWSPRRDLAGTYDADWMKTRMPLLPRDWNPRSLQCATPDQQSQQYLRGGESVELANLTPTGRLTFSLPKLGFSCLSIHKGQRHRHRPRLTCVIIEPDGGPKGGRLMMIWTSALSIRTDIDDLDQTLVQERSYEE